MTVQLLVRIEPCDNLKPPKATAIVVIFVRIQLCNYIRLSYSSCIAGPGHLFLWQDVVSLIVAICFLILSLAL